MELINSFYSIVGPIVAVGLVILIIYSIIDSIIRPSKNKITDKKFLAPLTQEEIIGIGVNSCLICGKKVEVTDASKIMATSKDITSQEFNYGNNCNNCNGVIHYKCCKYTVENENGVKIKTGLCSKCNKPILIFIPKQ